MARYLKTKVKTTATKAPANPKPKAPVKKKKSKKLTKAQVREILHFRRLVSYCLMLFSVIVALVNLSLIINGGWDDIGLWLFVGAPLLAFASICVSYNSRKHYFAIKRDAWFGIVLLVLTGILFCFEVMHMLIAPLMGNVTKDLDRSLIGEYSCASSEEKRDQGEFNVKITLGEKEFTIVDYKDSKDYAVGSYGVTPTGKNTYKLNTIIKENKSKDDKRGFTETSYFFGFDGQNVVVHSETNNIVRYCRV